MNIENGSQDEIQTIAQVAISTLDPNLSTKFVTIIGFLCGHPELASPLRGKKPHTFPSEAYISRKAQEFVTGRKAKQPGIPQTKQDLIVAEILQHYFDVPQADLKRADELHRRSMAAENMVGNLLERYLATVMEPEGYIWCSGSLVRAVDFVKQPSPSNDEWTLLQIKNRDNSENSSSSSIRKGTTIHKWFRSFSTKERTNWEEFPDSSIREHVSESGFRQFVADFLHVHRTAQ